MTKKLTRRTDDRWIGGVCSGIAAYLDVDVNVVRLLTVVATVLGAGSLILVYVVAWILVPAAATTPSAPAPWTQDSPPQ
ncbi:hypothetical protein GCM10027020_13750 [Nocardioides salsibiostraticola]